MKQLEFLRRNLKWSQRKLGDVSSVDARYICNAEKRGMILYPKQAKRLADALDWTGDPDELFKEVGEDD